MALRLRRGTDAERLTITPLEGELIYTTDTEKLFIGDGTTAGGNPVDTDSITDQLSDLTDVDLTGLADGQTIVYNLSNSRFEPGTVSTAIDDLTDVDTTGIVAGNILKWNGAAFIPVNEGGITEGETYNINIDGDLTGSVFGDDSTLIIDGLTNVVSPLTIKTGQIVADKLDPILLVNNLVEISAETLDDVGIRLRRLTTVADTTQTDIGSIYFDGIDKNNGNLQSTASYIITSAEQSGSDPYLKSKLVLGVIGGDGNATGDNQVTITWEGNVGMGTGTPSAKLDVQGPILPGVYADATARDAAITSPVAGMMIYVTDVSKFQGYDGTAWVNLN